MLLVASDYAGSWYLLAKPRQEKQTVCSVRLWLLAMVCDSLFEKLSSL